MNTQFCRIGKTIPVLEKEPTLNEAMDAHPTNSDDSNNVIMNEGLE